MLRWLGAAATRSQIGQDAGRELQVVAHIAGQRVQHVAVHESRPHRAFPQQGRQVIDVAAEGRELGAGRDERGEVVGAMGADPQTRNAFDEVREESAARKPGSSRACD